MKRLFQFVFFLALPAAPMFAQGGFANFPDRMTNFFWHESDPVEECYKGTIHQVTYVRFFLGSGNTNIFVRDYDTGVPCSCDIGPASQFRQAIANPFSLLRPLQESNCESANGLGGEDTIPGQAATGALNGFGGTGGQGVAWGPAPYFRSSNPRLETSATSVAARAAAPGSTFIYTRPFRELPAGPLITEAASEVAWGCNSKVNPTMFRVYHVDDVVKRYNMCTAQTVASIPVPDLPLQVRVSPDGSQAIVTSYSGAITFIDTATNTVSGSIRVPSDPNFAPSGLAIAPDGTYALATNYLTPPDSYLAVVDIDSKQIKKKIPLDRPYPQSVYINPDGTLAWVTYPWNSSVEVIDILTGTLVQGLVIIEPFSIAFSPNGTRAYISSAGGSVQVIDTSTYRLIKSVPAGPGATDLQVTPDGAFVYANNSEDRSITVIETQSLTSTTQTLSGVPQGSALVPPQ